MRRTFALGPILFAVACSSLGSPPPTHGPEGWVAIAPADTGHTEARWCEYWAANKWQAKLSNDSARLLLMPAPRWSSTTMLPLPNGRLEGWDGGEFGGGIFWRAESGVRDTVSKENLFAFVTVSGRILALVGLSHMQTNYGKLLELDTVDGRWHATELADLGAVPTAYSKLQGDSLLIATSAAVETFSFKREPLVLYRSNAFPDLRASSIVRDRAGVLYLTTRRIIVRLRPVKDGFEEDWLVPASCRRMRRVPRTMVDCVCVAETASTR